MGVDVKGFASTYDTQTEKVNTRNQVKTAGSPGKSRPKLLVQKYIPSSQTVTGGAGLPTHSYYNTRKDTYTLKDRGHKGWRQETIDKKSKEVIEGSS